MITSTVPPLLLPLRASRSLDSLCLPSARDNPAASRVISAKSASRAPQVVVLRTLPVEGRLMADISWAPKLPRRAKSFIFLEEDLPRIRLVPSARSAAHRGRLRVLTPRGLPRDDPK